MTYAYLYIDKKITDNVQSYPFVNGHHFWIECVSITIYTTIYPPYQININRKLTNIVFLYML